MVTPTREQIRELAQQKEREENGSLPSITCTDSELKENGSWFESRDQLMSDQATQATLAYLEQQAYDLGFELVKRKIDYAEDLEDFPLEDILKYACFVAGGRGSGKTNLLKLLVMEALKRKIELKVFDPSLAWKRFPLPKIIVTKENLEVASQWNTIYDISRLGVLEARNFVMHMLSEDLTEAIAATDIGMKPKCLVVIEEAQNIIPSHSLRSMKFLEISRFITQSRNFGLSFIASTQRLASVDINLIEISGVRYWFKLEGHRNLVKARYWLDKFTTWRLRDLEVGTCYIQQGSRIKLLRLPLFTIEKVVAR